MYSRSIGNGDRVLVRLVSGQRNLNRFRYQAGTPDLVLVPMLMYR